MAVEKAGLHGLYTMSLLFFLSEEVAQAFLREWVSENKMQVF